MTEKATITSKGAILLGKHVACDAFDETRPLRIVTHAHADHMMGLQQSLKKCERILMTKATKDLIDAMIGPQFLTKGRVETPDFTKTLQLQEESLTFLQADHILGATQVLVEDAEGIRIGYTGDFRIEKTPVLEADILVMEATYGNPTCRRPFKKDVNSMLVSLVERGLRQGTVYVFGFNGKLQEVMHILREARFKVPFVAPEKVFRLSLVCEQHGMHIGRLILSDEKEGKQMLERNMPCIAFYHTNSKGQVGHGAFQITVTGWEFYRPWRRIGENEYVVALSDHSDFDELIEYVNLSKPKLVITDGYRDGHAESFAKEIRNRFSIPAFALPKE
jgi:putative mRNA 3-end processing factor